MIAALIAASGIWLAHIPATVDLTPTDTIWVYSNASDPAHEDLYVWGSDGVSVAPTPAEGSEFSYGYLKWDLGAKPLVAAKLVSAQLIVTSAPDPGYTADDVKGCPLESRPVPPDFNSLSWTFDVEMRDYPDKDVKARFGEVVPPPIVTDGKTFKLTIDLLKGPNDFKKYLDLATQRSDHALAIALTSKLDPSQGGRSCVYHLYGLSGKDENRPVLKLTFGDK